MSKKPRSRKEVRTQKRKENFIGREEPKHQFAENFLRDDPVTVFSVTGEGGVGKSTLLKQFAAIATNQNAIVVICDEAHTSPASAMGHIVEELAKLKFAHSAFDDRYKEYRKMRQEVESDPKAPRGAIDLLARGLTDAAIKSARHLPGVSPFLEGVDEKAVGNSLSEFAHYAIDRWGNKDEVQLLREPEHILTPLFLELIAKVSENRPLVLMFDVFERTGESLGPWLLALCDFEYGDFNTNLTFVIAGRDRMESHWTELGEDICHIALDPFTPDETRAFLHNREITDDELVRQIQEDTGGLPLLVELLASANPQPGVPLPDVSRDAVKRFLQWMPQEDRRQAALLAAVPRQFNQDILNAALGRDTATDFGWISSQSYVRSNTERGLFYHEKLRELMLRHLQNTTPKLLADAHTRLAEFFSTSQQELNLEVEAAYDSETWCKRERERIYHIVSAQPDRNQKEIVNAFLNAFRRRRGFSEEIALCCQQISREEGLHAIRELSVTLLEIYRAYERDRSQTGIEKLGLLERRDDLTPVARSALHARRSNMHWFKGNFDQALIDLNRAIELDENYSEAITMRSLTYLFLGRREDAIADINRSIVVDEKDIVAVALRAIVFLTLGMREEALTDIRRAIDLSGEDSGERLLRAFAALLIGKSDVAVVEIKRVVDLVGKEVAERVVRGISYFSIRQGEEAIVEIKQALQIAKIDVREEVIRGFAYLFMGKCQEAMSEFDRALELDDKGAKWAVLGRFVSLLLVKQMTTLWPMIMQVSNQLGEFAGVPEKFLASIGFMVGLETIEPTTIAQLEDVHQANIDEQYARAVERLGVTYRSFGKFEEALAEFNRAIEFNGEDSSLRFERGITYLLMRRYDEALAEFNQVIELDEKNDRAIAFRGEILRRVGEFEGAIRDFTTVIEGREAHSFELSRRAGAYLAIGNVTAAQTDLAEVMKMPLKTVVDYYNYGIALVLSKMYGDAVVTFKRAFEMDTTAIHYAAVDDLLDPIRDNPEIQTLMENPSLQKKD